MIKNYISTAILYVKELTGYEDVLFISENKVRVWLPVHHFLNRIYHQMQNHVGNKMAQSIL